MCCITDPQSQGLPRPADGSLAFSLDGTEGVEWDPNPAPDLAPEFVSWNWDGENVEFPNSETQTGGSYDLAFAVDAASFDEFSLDDGQYSH